MIDKAGGYEDLVKRTRSVPMLMDLDERFRVMDMFDEYKQILSLTTPPLEVMFSPEDAAELQMVANDSMTELCEQYPDRFPGFTASLAMNKPDAAVAEVHRAVTDLGALGVQIFTNVAGRALDNPEFFPVFEAAHALDVPMWMHPARGADVADYKDEERSKYEIWWTLGWPYETSVAQARMVFSGMMDKLPGLKIITHHLGGLMPYFSGRTGPGWQFLGDRTSGPAGDEYRKSLENPKKPHAEYFKDFTAIRRCSVRSRRRNADWLTTPKTECCLPPTRRSIPRRGQCTSARPSKLSTIWTSTTVGVRISIGETLQNSCPVSSNVFGNLPLLSTSLYCSRPLGYS